MSPKLVSTSVTLYTDQIKMLDSKSLNTSKKIRELLDDFLGIDRQS